LALHPVTDDFGIDYTRPVLSQLSGLGDRYWEWSHQHLTPAFRRQLAEARPDDPYPSSFPIFAQPILEAQTHIHWRQVLGLWGVVVVSLVALAVMRFPVDPSAGVGWWLVGFLLWTLVEYVLHRVIFHREPRSLVERKFHFLAHGIHHKDPWDSTRLVFPLLGGMIIASLIYSVLAMLLPTGPSLLAMSGLLVGYLAYDIGHLAWHHASFRAPWFRYLQRYHLAHHYKDRDSRFGVSQPLWDWVFRSGDLKM